jgi:hypothetical protein
VFRVEEEKIGFGTLYDPGEICCAELARHRSDSNAVALHGVVQP